MAWQYPAFAFGARQLAQPGLLLLEIEASQGAAVENLAKHAFPRARIECSTTWPVETPDCVRND